MDKRNCHVLGILLMLAVASESGVIVPREATSGDGELPRPMNKFDKKLGLSPWHPEEGGDEFGAYDDGIGVNNPHAPPDYDDYSNHGEGDADRNEPGIIKPEIISPHEDRDEKPIENHGGKEVEHNIPKDTEKEDDIDREPGDEDHEPFDGEEDIDKSVGDDEDSKIPAEEDKGKPNHKDEDDEKKEPEEEEDDDDDKKEPEEEDDDDKKGPEEEEDDDEKKESEEEEEDDDDEKKEPEEDDDGKEEPEDDDEKKIPEDDGNNKDLEEDYNKTENEDEENPDEKDMPKEDEEDGDKDKSVPEDDDEQPDEEDKDDENNVDGEESEFFKGGKGSIFDTPFFNVDKVKKYFHELERALGRVFRETVDEAILLNGTYANTTEEEVDINGKKFVVHKSVIQGRDNHSTIYVETLSSAPKTNGTEDIEVIEMKNITET